MSDLLTVKDQMGREVTFPFPPRRIVSLVPSQTEFLIDIGAPVVGRTKFCIHPKNHVSAIPIIGGTKNFRFDTIKRINPDLIVGNKEENYEEGIEALAEDFPVWMSDIVDLDGAYEMMSELGRLCELSDQLEPIIEECKQSVSRVHNSKSGRVLYFIWKDPWMVAGKGTFIDHMLDHLGYENLIAKERYPTITKDEIDFLDPDIILLSSEPFPFKEKHVEEVKSRWPKATIRLADGELFSWYGSRLRHWKNYF